jgi:hypothetical protein
MPRSPTSTTSVIRRFLLHVLPGGFQRIRHYGFLAKAKLARCRQLLAEPAPARLKTLCKIRRPASADFS